LGDGLKWTAILFLLAIGVWGNDYYADVSLLYRILSLSALGLLAGGLAFWTRRGQAVWVLMKEARMEIRKVIWPNRQETTQTTVIVLLLVLLAALILWLLDWGLGSLIDSMLGI